MRSRGLIGVGVLGFVLYGSGVAAQDFGRYREFELGSAVAAVSTLTGVAGSELKATHQRPAVIQELTWRPRYGARLPVAPDTESVEQMVFGFYDDRLFRVTVLSFIVAGTSPRPSALLVALIGVALPVMMPLWTGSQLLATAGTARRS